jgi:hypothetical protein
MIRRALKIVSTVVLYGYSNTFVIRHVCNLIFAFRVCFISYHISESSTASRMIQFQMFSLVLPVALIEPVSYKIFTLEIVLRIIFE